MDAGRAVVVHEEDLAREDWDDPIRGALGFYTVFSAGSTATSTLTAGIAVLPPGGWLGAHRHAPAEVYHVLEGEGLVVVAGRQHAVRAGSSVFIPASEEHAVHNTGPSPLRFFYTFPVDSFTDIEYHFSDVE